jgi:gluconolactonase
MGIQHQWGDNVEIFDRAFESVLAPDTGLRCVADGFQFTEGPVWLDSVQLLLFSDIPANTVYRWTEGDGHSVWHRPSNQANGHTLDLQGRVVACEHGSRSLTRIEEDGSVTTLATTYRGGKLNSPNDAVVKSDGSIWFTDPPYGIEPGEEEQAANYVFRLEVGAPEPAPVADDFSRPNGLCFSPDERHLYIADSDPEIHHVRCFQVEADGSLRDCGVFATIDPGVPDGMRMDRDGRLFSSAGDGVHVFSAEGQLLGKIRTPESASNCAFGGEAHAILFITAVSSVWAINLATAAAGR